MYMMSVLNILVVHAICAHFAGAVPSPQQAHKATFELLGPILNESARALREDRSSPTMALAAQVTFEAIGIPALLLANLAVEFQLHTQRQEVSLALRCAHID